jgi:ACR3 family arsenite efflux pump ArsB
VYGLAVDHDARRRHDAVTHNLSKLLELFFFPAVFHLIGSAEVAKVNLPVAVLIWLMIIPMLVKIDFAALARVKEHWRGIGVTLFINWAVKPFSMAFLGWLFTARSPMGRGLPVAGAGIIALGIILSTVGAFLCSDRRPFIAEGAPTKSAPRRVED